MRKIALFLPALLLGAFIACVGDTPTTVAPVDSGGVDVVSDQTQPGSDSGFDTSAPDTSDAARPVPIPKGDFNWRNASDGSLAGPLAYDNQGNLFFILLFYNSTKVAGKTFTSVGAEDILLIKADPSGKVLWTRQYGGAGDDGINAMAVDPSGDVYMTFLSPSSGFSFGNGIAYAKQGTNADGFLVKVKGTNGDGMWLMNPTKSNENYMACGQLAYGGGKLAIECWSYQGPKFTKASDSSAIVMSCLECGGNNSQTQNAYFASLDPATGKAYWTNVIAANNSLNVVSMGVDSKGAVVFDFVNFGAVVHDPTNTINLTYQGTTGAAALVAKLSGTNGAGVWIKEFNGAGNNNQTGPGGIAFDSLDNVVMGGSIFGTVSIGSIQVTSAGGNDSWIASLKGTFGDTLWARSFGGSLDERAAWVGVDPWDEIYATGEYLSANGKIDSLPIPGTTGGHQGVYMAKFDPGGKGLWATAILSSTTNPSLRAYNPIAVDRQGGGMAITGYYQGTVDLGDGTPVTSPNGVGECYVVARKP